jgi:membrane associated rhomboid family serine protease
MPSSVGVGSSGALMGMLSSWLTWIIFRWQKIPPECKSQRNCQLLVVSGAIIITLATSAMPNVDWAAHLGGAIQGVLWGCVLLGNEIESQQRVVLRVISAMIAVILFIISLYYMIVLLKPSKYYLDYWEENDN